MALSQPVQSPQTGSCCASCDADFNSPKKVAPNSGEHHDEHDHDHGSGTHPYLPALISFIMLMAGLAIDHLFPLAFFGGWIRLLWYVAAYLPVALPVFREMMHTFARKDFFTEFSLMSLATIGAFAIGEYPEGVAVMLFYSIGELFQASAVKKARRSISALLDVRPATADVFRQGSYQTVEPEGIQVGEIIRVRVGDRVPLDGIIQTGSSSFDTSALTGESKPSTMNAGENVLAGMVNLTAVVEVKVTKPYKDSSLSRILEMVQEAAARKAPTELRMRRLARIYTPAVFFLALAVVGIPYFFVQEYIFQDWLYRGLVFLVISCPCALVISIPLGYFGGIGAASRNGILFKGANFLDMMTRVDAVAMDKTGTLTQGVFQVQDVRIADHITLEKFSAYLSALERNSTHPVAKAITLFWPEKGIDLNIQDVKEIAGHGLQANIADEAVAAGNVKLLRKMNIAYPSDLDAIPETVVVLAVNNQYAGHVTVADAPKTDAELAIQQLKEAGIKRIVMLSGDKTSIVNQTAARLGITEAHGDLLPEDKLHIVEAMKREGATVAFAGDGINDAPVLAASDVGMAMGGMGSDAAIETADVVIQTDQPSRIATAIQIGHATNSVVTQNIVLAFAVKGIVLLLGAGGLATLWEAVFADVGVSLLAILNAVRIQRMKF